MNLATLSTVFEYLSSNPVIVIFGAGTIIALFGIVFGSLTSIFRSVSRERTRREIAAYIAEGSMSPEQGERLLSAGSDSDNA
ncbi:MAG: hypothetical protein D8M59_08515 [Planctomycetes bacterium]|nr:hypothetical protein [Planctomycetota bacterium]NOG53961.1 hypothetical protein [Planctomycetota bacterium]